MRALADGYLLRDDGVIEVSPDVAYPRIVAELGLVEEKLDQYWLEVVYQIAKMDAQRLVQGTSDDPRPRGAPLQIHIRSGAVKERWQIKRRPFGRGVFAATKGKEARGHYRRIRGELPE